jgi:adenosylhomocysteine nucleosidase
MRKIGIMSAMIEEMETLLKNLEKSKISTIGQREYHSGKLWGIDVVLVFSRWGKVAASSTTTTLITKFEVDEIIFTGVAGAVDGNVNIGDVVVAENLFQHDFDASPFLQKHVLPFILKKEIPTNTIIRTKLKDASVEFFKNQINDKISNDDLKEFQIVRPKVAVGSIASGDQFIKEDAKRNEIKSSFKNVLAVEMEGAAVAQVCYEFNVPLGVIRTISDDANDNAIADFPKFINKVASIYSFSIIKNYLKII